MPQTVNVHMLPSLVTPEQLVDTTIVVMDVLRATTTIVHALAAGANAVVPCLEVDEARRRANQLGKRVVMGGERRGLPIEGFDLGNSPAEFTTAAVGGRTVVFTTTNGTRAFISCAKASRVIVGAFVNLSAVCQAITACNRVELLCAGTASEITREDALLAGAIVDQLERANQKDLNLNDQACLAADAWRFSQSTFRGKNQLHKTLRASLGGRNMINIGLDGDINVAATIDKFTIVPELDIGRWIIRLP